MRIYTLEQAISATEKLHLLARNEVFGKEILHIHKEGLEYTSLMMCFGSHIFVSIETLLKLNKEFKEWFPSTVAFVILRSMFEALIEAHYISKEPKERASAYIKYDAILNFKRFNKIEQHSETQDVFVKKFFQSQLNSFDKIKVKNAYEKNKSEFEYIDKKGKTKIYSNWANKSLKEKAKEVEHEIEYDWYYSYFSNFTHANVIMANRFLKVDENRPYWSMKADEVDVGYIFLFASEILACFLSLISKQFDLKIEKEIENCLYAFGKINLSELESRLNKNS